MLALKAARRSAYNNYELAPFLFNHHALHRVDRPRDGYRAGDTISEPVYSSSVPVPRVPHMITPRVL